MFHDWHQFHLDEATSPTVVDSRRRLLICRVVFLLLIGVVFGRAVHIEVTQGAAFRDIATKPISKESSIPGIRGRILAVDGTVLALDKDVLAVAVKYRYLEDPPDSGWLRRTARARLDATERKDPQRILDAEAEVRTERLELATRLADLGGLTRQQYQRRARRIQARVVAIAESVARRRGKKTVIAEQLDAHILIEDVAPQVAARVKKHPEQFPGVEVIEHSRRTYPLGTMAAHVLGHLGPVKKDELTPGGSLPAYHSGDLVGRAGLERQYETVLRGRRGVAVELTDHGGRTVERFNSLQPGAGHDLVLTLRPQLQRAAETLLDSALRRSAIRTDRVETSGGAIVVMDIHSGALLAAASAPRFDPGLFVGGSPDEVARLLADPRHPLFDRVSQMAIPPGSVFKTVTAAALLESAAVDPSQPFFCQGYLHRPDRQRCAIFVRHGVGHGEVTLGDALAQSCNVYFFHHAGEMGLEPLVDWAARFGFGRRTGVDLRGEAAGIVPDAATAADTQSTAIGQGSLTVTPLQVIRMTAAVANGGRLVTPHFVSREQTPAPQPIPGLSSHTLAQIRAGLRRVVSDREGTAHATVHLETIAVAGKTGTAETGRGETGTDGADHAWFAGYVPADRPKLALVVVLEHAGNAATTAGPVAKRMVMQMQQLGLLLGHETNHSDNPTTRPTGFHPRRG